MDPRIREHAETIVGHSADVQPDDSVVVSAPGVAEDLAVALHEAVGDRGASPVYLASDDRAGRAYLKAVDEADIETPTHLQALYEESDVLLRVRAETNATEQGDVDPGIQAAFTKARRPVQEVALSKRWCLTQFPSPASAQLAGMSTEGYENFVWDAINKDWSAQREHQAQMVEVLDPAGEVRIVSGDTTDVTMSVDGMHTINDYAEKNLPGGEVFTAPVVDSVEGEVLFDKPLYHQGREITGAHLVFEAAEELDLEPTDPTDERYLNDSYVALFDAVEDAMADLLSDDSPEALARAYSHYHVVAESVLAQTAYYSLQSAFSETGDDAVITRPREEMPTLEGLVEGIANIRSDEGRHVGFGMHEVRRLVQEEGVDESVVRETLTELMPHVAGIFTDIEGPINHGAIVEYARDKLTRRLDIITDADETVPPVEELVAIGGTDREAAD